MWRCEHTGLCAAGVLELGRCCGVVGWYVDSFGLARFVIVCTRWRGRLLFHRSRFGSIAQACSVLFLNSDRSRHPPRPDAHEAEATLVAQTWLFLRNFPKEWGQRSSLRAFALGHLDTRTAGMIWKQSARGARQGQRTSTASNKVRVLEAKRGAPR